jgi:predicted dehydrogenase
VQAYNNVPYGGVYFHNWYRDENETGGLFLQKATHDFDYINFILGIKPVRVCAMTSKQIFKGNKPANLLCKDCDEQETCAESPFSLDRNAFEKPSGPFCSFGVDVGNEDSGSALVEYETGMHVSYSQNFFARKKAATRGARFFGYKGTVEFDWYDDEARVYMHHTPRVETYKLDSSKISHGGGDAVLSSNFVKVMKGKENSVAPLSAGLISVLMCLKARESAKTKTYQEIVWPDKSI